MLGGIDGRLSGAGAAIVSLDLDAAIAAARARIHASILRRVANAKAEGKPHPRRSAGQYWRWLKRKDNDANR